MRWPRPKLYLDEALAGAGSVVALLVVTLVVWWWLGVATVDGRARVAAGPLRASLEASNLVVVDPSLGRGAQDLGRILFPFRPAAAITASSSSIDVDSFPFSHQFSVGSVGGDLTAGAGPQPLGDPIRVHRLGDSRRLLLSLVDYGSVGVETDAGSVPCAQRHHSTGVACGAEAWHFVGPVVEKIDDRLTLCLWAHPPASQRRLTFSVELPAALLAETPRLSVGMRFLDQVRGEGRRAPVRLDLLGPAGQSATASCSNVDAGCDAELTFEAGTAARVAIGLETADNGRQLVCLTGGLVAAPEVKR